MISVLVFRPRTFWWYTHRSENVLISQRAFITRQSYYTIYLFNLTKSVRHPKEITKNLDLSWRLMWNASVSYPHIFEAFGSSNLLCSLQQLIILVRQMLINKAMPSIFTLAVICINKQSVLIYLSCDRLKVGDAVELKLCVQMIRY